MDFEVAFPSCYRHTQQRRHFRHQVCHHVCHEEREKEPAGDVAVELARLPQVAPFHLLGKGIVGVEDEADKEEIDEIADGAPHHVGGQQPFRLVFQVFLRVARHRLVEVTCLEEKEGHEEIRPVHDGCPPVCIAKATGVGDVQQHHTDDADAAQEVESMITSPHLSFIIYHLSFLLTGHSCHSPVFS